MIYLHVKTPKGIDVYMLQSFNELKSKMKRLKLNADNTIAISDSIYKGFELLGATPEQQHEILDRDLHN